mmetsp:Transcript_11950/g.18147  ORF Transcript_11950/g.18147 Transcript_11950/m.18147 type:complete len:200 (-) Transcript_11950:195-794(-)
MLDDIPSNIAAIVTPMLVRSAGKSIALSMFFPFKSLPSLLFPSPPPPRKARCEYSIKLAGNMMILIIVLIDVIAIESSILALKDEQSKFEYDPPGEAVTMSRVNPIGVSSPWFLNVNTETNPRKGMTMNCIASPTMKVSLLFNCFLSSVISIDADMPNTKKKSKSWVRIFISIGVCFDASSFTVSILLERLYSLRWIGI